MWTHTEGKAQRWAAEHEATAVETPAEVAAASDIVVSMVVDGAQVESVLCGENGVARRRQGGAAVRGHVHDRSHGHAPHRAVA